MSETITCPRCGVKDVTYTHDDHFSATDHWIIVECPECGSFPHQVR